MNFVKSTAGRLLIAALCIAATQAAVWSVHYRARLAAAQTAKFDVAALPLELGQWSGSSRELDPRLFAKVGALSMVDRMYQSETGRQVSVHLASYPADEMDKTHGPTLCYPGGGWTILGNDWQVDGSGRRYRLMHVERDGIAAAVVYWYQLGSAVGSDRADVRKIVQELRWQGKAWPPLVKVMMHIPIEFSEDDAKKAVEDLGAGIYDWIKNNS